MSEIIKNITKGDWFSCCTDNRPHFAFAHEGNVTVCGFHKEQQLSEDLSLEEVQANAQLIADAGTTANKCGKLPSELLEINEELFGFLKNIHNKKTFHQGDFDALKEIIQKHTQ